MNWLMENIRLAISALLANKLRAVLTTLGVVIGITTVLLMGWFISGLNDALESTLAIFGEDVLYVDRWDWTGRKSWEEQRNRQRITYAQFKDVSDQMNGAEYVVPTVRRTASSVRSQNVDLANIEVVGTHASYVKTVGSEIALGRFFNQVEQESGSAVAVLGAGVADKLFGEGRGVGEAIRINGLPFNVVGVFPKRGALGMNFIDNAITIPLKRFYAMFGSRAGVTITIKTGGAERLDAVRDEAMGVMRQVRSISPGAEDDFSINSQDAFREQLDTQRLIVYGVGLAMTGLSFLVGAIGIMNIMFVSVSERTKEIGIRKALGATRRSILMQFLVEAVVLCLLGAAVGMGFTSVLAVIIKNAAEIDFLTYTIPLSQVVVAVVMAVFVGILAGIIPANRAAGLDPVEALRSE